MPNLTSVVFTCGETTNGELKVAEKLLGLRVHGVGGGFDNLLALADSGCYDLTTSERITPLHFMDVNVGKGRCVALSAANTNISKGQLYSWGAGAMGQLGQGRRIAATEPSLVKAPSPSSTEGYKQVACGHEHSVAIDQRGNMIAWGLNYDRQLGLYKKSAMQLNQVGEIRGTCAVVEEMLMIPRLCPISLATPIVKVACGAFFTAAVTTGGELYTWGAGECGQLGVSRCTRKELPQLIILIPKLKAQMRRLTVKARDRLSVRRNLYGELMAAVRSDNVEGVQTLLDSAGADVVLLANPPSKEVGCALGFPLHHGTSLSSIISSIIPTNPPNTCAFQAFLVAPVFTSCLFILD